MLYLFIGYYFFARSWKSFVITVLVYIYNTHAFRSSQLLFFTVLVDLNNYNTHDSQRRNPDKGQGTRRIEHSVILWNSQNFRCVWCWFRVPLYSSLSLLSCKVCSYPRLATLPIWRCPLFCPASRARRSRGHLPWSRRAQQKPVPSPDLEGGSAAAPAHNRTVRRQNRGGLYIHDFKKFKLHAELCLKNWTRCLKAVTRNHSTPTNVGLYYFLQCAECDRPSFSLNCHTRLISGARQHATEQCNLLDFLPP